MYWCLDKNSAIKEKELSNLYEGVLGMTNEKNSNIVVCSVMIKPARLLFFYKLRTWIDQVVRIVVHTYVVDEKCVPLDPENTKGYWYCAGDFCDIDEAGVTQDIINADIGYAKCLVSPDIKDDDIERPQRVISGEYGVHYVCHNITNRVLFASNEKYTLVDIEAPITGYEAVVKSALGIYGQNQVEWHRRCQFCNSSTDDPKELVLTPDNRPKIRTRSDEISRIHTRAASGNVRKAERLTEALSDIDSMYLANTEKLILEYERNELTIDNFNILMVNETANLFQKTISTVGREVAQKIYPDCNLDIEKVTLEQEPVVQYQSMSG